MSGKQPEKDNPIHQQPPDKNIFGLETPLDLDYQDPYFQGPQADEVASKEENTLDLKKNGFGKSLQTSGWTRTFGHGPTQIKGPNQTLKSIRSSPIPDHPCNQNNFRDIG